jgi:hypothetical protein
MMQLELNVSISPSHEHGYGRLEIRESAQLGTLSFLEMSVVLAAFHELVQQIQSERKPK